MKEITTREEFLEKFGKEKVTFSSYYKYTFTYSCITDDGLLIVVHTGGDSDGIYRKEVLADEEYTIESLSPFSGDAHRGVERIAHFYEY